MHQDEPIQSFEDLLFQLQKVVSERDAWMGKALQMQQDLDHINSQLRGVEEVNRRQYIAIGQLTDALSQYRRLAGGKDDQEGYAAMRAVQRVLSEVRLLRAENSVLNLEVEDLARERDKDFWFKRYQKMAKEKGLE